MLSLKILSLANERHRSFSCVLYVLEFSFLDVGLWPISSYIVCVVWGEHGGSCFVSSWVVAVSVLPWCQGQKKTRQDKKTTDQWPHEHRHKHFRKNFSKLNSSVYKIKWIMYHDQPSTVDSRNSRLNLQYQSVRVVLLLDGKKKTLWSYQLMQQKHLTKVNTLIILKNNSAN